MNDGKLIDEILFVCSDALSGPRAVVSVEGMQKILNVVVRMARKLDGSIKTLNDSRAGFLRQISYLQSLAVDAAINPQKLELMVRV